MAHGAVGEPGAVRGDGNAVDTGLHYCETAEEDHAFGRCGDDPVLGGHRWVALENHRVPIRLWCPISGDVKATNVRALENPAIGAGSYVVDNDRGPLAPEADVGDEDRTPIGAHLQVLEEGTVRCGNSIEPVVVHDLVGEEIKRHQPGGSETMPSVIDDPQTVLAIDHHAQGRLEQRVLQRLARVGPGDTVTKLEQFGTFRS